MDVFGRNSTRIRYTGGGGVGIGVTPAIEGVEPSSSAAAGDRLLIDPNQSFSSTCLGEPERLARNANSKKKKMEKLEVEFWQVFKKFGSGA